MFNFLNTADPKANRNRLVLLLIAVMLVGMIAGVTMNRQPAPPPAEVQTQTVTQKETPQACLDYITYSEEGFGLAEESMTYAGEAFQAIADYDLKAARQASDDMRSVKPKLDDLAPKLLQAKEDCRASK